jgi:transposase
VSGEYRSIASVAASFGVSWDTVMRAVRDDAERVLANNDGQRVAAFGLDETVMNPSGSHTRRRYVTVFVDLDRHRVIDVVAGRHAATVTSWLEQQDPSWRAQITTVALDPHAGYRTAVTDPRVGFDSAQLVADCFHFVKLANAAIDDVHRRSSRKPPAIAARSTIRSTASAGRCWSGSSGSMMTPWLASASRLLPATPTTRWAAHGLAKELVRDIFATHDPEVAARRLVAFYDWVADLEVPELVRLATTLSRWQDEILAYHHTGGVSSARVEAIKPRRQEHQARRPAGSPASTTTAPASSPGLARHGRLPPPPDSEARTPSPWQRDPPSSRRAPF